MRLSTMLALVGAVCMWVPAAAHAADGIKATAIATRALPADLLQVTFNISERIGAEEATKAGDGVQAVVDGLTRRGFEVVSRTVAFASGYKSSGASGLFGRDASAREPLDLTRTHTLRIKGFKRVEDVLVALTQSGVRNVGSPQLLSSQLDAARSELSLEAARMAVAKARALAKALDVAAGPVIDVTVADTGAPHGAGTGLAHVQAAPYPHAAHVGPGGQLEIVVAVAASVTLERLPR